VIGFAALGDVASVIGAGQQVVVAGNEVRWYRHADGSCGRCDGGQCRDRARAAELSAFWRGAGGGGEVVAGDGASRIASTLICGGITHLCREPHDQRPGRGYCVNRKIWLSQAGTRER